ncbi:MAG: hypothetical protein ACOYM1_11995 [Methylovulum sp.]|jgi:hypothetical protein
MKQMIFASAIAVASNIAVADAVIDVTKIAGKSKSEVTSYLGTPSSCGSSKYGEKCQYKKGETEIVFIAGKADWITIEGVDEIPFSSAILGALGLEEKKPTFKNDFTLRWEGVQGIMEVSVFKGASASDYAYIKVKTK